MKIQKETQNKKLRKPRTSAGLILHGILAIGVALLLAVSCAPSSPSPSTDGGSNNSPAPAVVTDLVIDTVDVESTSFVVQWGAPTSTGTKTDGTALSPAEVGYRIYYLAVTTNQATPSAKLVREGLGSRLRVVKGELQARIPGLEPETRYFVTVVSYNPFISQQETKSDEVIEVITSEATANLEGSLVYEQGDRSFIVGIEGTITPVSAPVVPATDVDSTSIRYSLEKMDGIDFIPPLVVGNDGIITINSISNAGTARYFVRVEATGYIKQNAIISIVVEKANFEESLAYATTAYKYSVGSDNTIIPEGIPNVPSTDPNGVAIRYSLAGSSGTVFNVELTMNENNGVITVNPITTEGTATYTVRAEADGYNMQEATLTVTIVENANANKIQASTYYSNAGEMTDVIPVALGQAVADDSSTFSMSDDTVILTLSNLTNGDHLIHFGTEAEGGANTYVGTYQKMAANNTITILKSELAVNSFSFVDGAVIGISGSGITDTQHIATYRPSNIYTPQDLQGMRVDLDQDYILKRDILFTPMTDSAGTAVSNYEAVGNDSDPFTGSLDGMGHTITGVEIEGSNDYQGLFGAAEASATGIAVAQNLILNDFKIAGNAYVGSLAGQVKQGTIDSVRVEVSGANTGKIEVKGSLEINYAHYGYGGGLLGRASGAQVRIRNTSSAVAVLGTGVNSNHIGGLVGDMGDYVELTESSATGSVIGSERIGGLVGNNSGGTVTGSATGSISGNYYIGGLVGNNNGGIVTGFATGDVTGSGDDIGGLAGNNSFGTVRGYATGSVTGSSNSVGGLVGSSAGSATGYATGDVTGIRNIGGLVGISSGGTTVGYATGDVAGEVSIGGLVGFSSGFVTGYAIGDVTGSGDNTGGLVGYNFQGPVVGYARGIVRRVGGTGLGFGKLVGSVRSGVLAIYSSVDESADSLLSESQVYDGAAGTTALIDATGEDGTAVDIASATQAMFADFAVDTNLGFAFGTDLGRWTWVADSTWPAINIGEIKPAPEQPVYPSSVARSELE